MPPTLKDVSRLANTSGATASMILNRGQADRFKDSTRRRVVEAAEQLGYHVQRSAQMLRTGETRNVAVLINDLANGFFGRYTSLIQQRLLREDYTAIPLETRGCPDRQRELLAWLPQRAVDGVIDLEGLMNGGNAGAVAGAGGPAAGALPIVFRAIRSATEQPPPCSVEIDYQVGADALALHLASLGCRWPALAVIDSHVGDAGNASRPPMLREALRRAGLPADTPQWWGLGTEDALEPWYAGVRSKLRAHPEADGLIVHNMALLPPVLAAVADAGRAVGRDIAVACFDDGASLPYLGGGVTAIREPVDVVAVEAVALLLDRLRRPEREPEPIRLRTELVVRPSTASVTLA